jgi:RHS repeat-associated protein
MTNDGQNTLVYDAENRVTSSTGPGSGTYTYDGNGLRVKKVSGSTSTVYAFSGAKVIAEYLNGAAPSSPSREYIYLAGALLASVANGAVTYYHQDHLSNRLATNSSGAATEQLGNFPFGESWYTATGEKWLFTSYERDSESNNDYALARYYVNRFGRFLSADPLSGSVADPQSLNRYAYVENDPINAADPSGLKMMPPLAWLGLQIFFGDVFSASYNTNFLGGGASELSLIQGITYWAWNGSKDYPLFYQVGSALGLTDGTQQPPPVSPQSSSPSSPPKKKCPPNKQAFFNALGDIFKSMAKTANTDADFIAALSAYESGWLGPHAQDLNNPFGLTAAGGNDLSFSSYQGAADYWMNKAGKTGNGYGGRPSLRI